MFCGYNIYVNLLKPSWLNYYIYSHNTPNNTKIVKNTVAKMKPVIIWYKIASRSFSLINPPPYKIL